MVKRIEINEFGGPDVMKLVDAPEPVAGADEIVVQQRAIGLNYIDTYHRSGLYPMALPTGIGMEGAGDVLSIGSDVTGISVGDRVAYCSGPIGAYTERHAIKADRALILPEDISYDIAAASLLKGLTVQYLIRQIHKTQAGDTVLFHAAAGGVGLIACQWLKHLGATVIGTVSSEEKEALARDAGCDHVIRYDHEDIAARVTQITNGQKVPVVFDGVGAATWGASLDSVQKLGLIVSFGNASGPVTDVNLGVLAAKGSIFVTRPTLYDYTADRADLEAAAADFFDVLTTGAVTPPINAVYALSDIVQAHMDLESRKTTGSTIIRP